MDLSERTMGAKARHPWEIARLASLRRLVGVPQDRPLGPVLDIGCGDGYATAGLWQHRRVLRIDAVDTALGDEEFREFSDAYPGVSFHRSLEGIAADGTYDVVTLLDVIEHEQDDVGLLRRVARLLAPRGRMIVTVPAHPSLYSSHDAFLGHHRRYTSAALRHALAAAGLRCDAWGYLFAPLLPVRAAQVLVERLAGRRAREHTAVGTWSGGPLVTWPLAWLLTGCDRMTIALAGRGVRFPGLSLWARCTRPS